MPQARAPAVVHVIANAVSIGVNSTVPPHSPMASSWFPSQSQSSAGCQNIHGRRWRQDGFANTTNVKFSNAVVDVSQMPSASLSTTQSPPQSPMASSWFRHSRSHPRDVRTSTVVDGTRAVADAASIELSTQSSTSSQMPSASASTSQSPPHTPRRRAGFRRSRSLLWDVRTSTIVDGTRMRYPDAASTASDAVVYVSRCRRHRRQRRGRHHRRPRRRVSFRHSRSLLLGCQNIHNRR